MSELKALITGGTRGIGKAIALALASDGIDVFAVGRKPGDSDPDICFIACNLEQKDDLQSLEEKIAKEEFDILVNNAGMNLVGCIEDYSASDFNKIQQLNTVVPFRLSKACIPYMKKKRFGRIINIGSIFGHVSKEYRFAYSTSKFALYGLTKSFAVELAKDNVLVNCIAPGFVDTDLTKEVLGSKGTADMVKRIPMGRLAQPEEIARLARFLCSAENTYLTGQQIIIDGGFTSV
jgi:3-oxoacyl-[acyl-carrier protein] reductase